MVATILQRCYSTTPGAKGDAANALRQLMRKVAQPVAVITVKLDSSVPQQSCTATEEHDHGATLSSLSSISLSPPLVAFSLRLPSRLASHLSTPSAPLSIHLLASTQENVARAFARQPPLPLPATPSPPPASQPPPPSEHFPPSLFRGLDVESLGSLRCTILQSVPLSDLGGHSAAEDAPRSELFIARVDEVKLGQEDETTGSLVYWDQAYRAVSNVD